MNQIEQAIVVKKEELHRLDLTKLDNILTELSRIQNGKSELNSAMREELNTKFFGVLRTVSTVIHQESSNIHKEEQTSGISVQAAS
jgi:DNA replication protein DnaD